MTVDELRARIVAAGESVTLSDTVHEDTCALVLGMKVRTLREHRAAGISPAFVCVGRSIFYRLADILSYLEARRFDPAGK